MKRALAIAVSALIVLAPLNATDAMRAKDSFFAGLAFPRAAHAAPEELFAERAAATGLVFTHVNGAQGRYYLPEVMGAGAALFDFDNDGDLDVFLVQGGALDRGQSPVAPRRGPTPTPVEAQPAPAPAATSRLFRNDLTVGADGRRSLRFTDVTAAAGVGLRAYGMGVAVGDYDSDSRVDLFVTAFGPDTLYHNNGDGTFTDVTRQAGVSDAYWSTSAAFVDYDRDGRLDLYVANYVDFTIAANQLCSDPVGARDYCGPRAYHPVPDRLYRNEGNGRFANATEAAGISKADGAGLGVSTGDYNGDGWIDLYVANDATPNQLWINQHNGSFADEGPLSGSAVNAQGRPEGSMGIASGDVDLDGDEDLFVTNIAGETSVLYVNDGRGSFDDARSRWGLALPTAPFTGFGTSFFDYDNDGWPDLLVANGAVNIVEAQRGQPSPYRMKNQLFRNTAARRFEETSAAGGAAFARAEIGRGAAFGDIDNDGDVDVVVTNNNGPVRLLLNQAGPSTNPLASPSSGQGSRNHWLAVRVTQATGNRFGVGALVGVERAGRPTLWRRVRSDGSYLSASDLRVHFGLGASPLTDGVVVKWPDGRSERWTGIAGDKLVTLERGTGKSL
jgi:hypothetical protein